MGFQGGEGEESKEEVIHVWRCGSALIEFNPQHNKKFDFILVQLGSIRRPIILALGRPRQDVEFEASPGHTIGTRPARFTLSGLAGGGAGGR